MKNDDLPEAIFKKMSGSSYPASFQILKESIKDNNTRMSYLNIFK